MYAKKKIGFDGESLACRHLERIGYKILERNYLIRGGEIDIVAKVKDLLVFVEVKARHTHEYGLPEESITPWKIRSLKKSASFYIQKIRWGDKPYRFDLVSIDFAGNEKGDIKVIENIIEL